MNNGFYYDNPQDAPETLTAADGKTILHRYKVEGVIFARDESEAKLRLSEADVYLDAARLVDGTPPAQKLIRRLEEDATRLASDHPGEIGHNRLWALQQIQRRKAH